ncbi:ROK family protein [Corynebacterium sp.]|uniref:ROK family protein n=1 Tax=Corynebacterium sp. TaxID=1720 RepID=UPI0026DEAE81|nr:ROK family protein [Corynebacterium sp.]MDO5511197.1 ROK family protein [Corynebacterium sp.]
MNTVGFDIGGTQCRAAVVTADGKILKQRTVPTPRTAAALEDAVAALVDELRPLDPGAVGLAVAGFLDPQREIVRFAPHLPWRDTPVRARLQERLGLPVVMEHDANSAAWGEYRFGAARGVGTWVFFAVGTGIGAALMIDGEIFRGAYGTAPEFGHLTVVRGGRECACGKRGCLERYASGTALADTAEAHGMGPGLSGHAIMTAARSGDERARAVLADFAGWLGQGLSMVADVLDPEVIVLGGGVAADADLFLPDAVADMGRSIVGAGHRILPVVGTAELGAHAGMIGVSDLARTELTGE